MMGANTVVKLFKKKVVFISAIICTCILLSIIVALTKALAATEAKQIIHDPTVMCWAFISAALSTGIAAIGAGIAVAYVGSASVGAIGEKPELAGKTLIFVGLAEGIAIYGLIISIMILGKI